MPLRKLRWECEGGWEREGLGEKERAGRLVEMNVEAGVRGLRENAAVIEAMGERGLCVHGVVYDVASGVLRELEIKESEAEGKRREEAFATK